MYRVWPYPVSHKDVPAYKASEIWIVFSALRLYSVYDRNVPLSVLVLALGLMPVITTMVRSIFKLCAGRHYDHIIRVGRDDSDKRVVASL